MKISWKTIGLAVAMLVCAGSIANAGSLENLERERAILLETVLDPAIAADDRQNKIAVSYRRLVDLERIAIRDKKVIGKNTPMVRRAFASYDLTFLVHASIENQTTVVDQWLGEIGLTTASIMSARIGRR